MSKFPIFLGGMVVGAGLAFVGLKYHFVRANDGLHVISKTTPKLGQIYVDVRAFKVGDWQENQDLLYAVTKSGNSILQEEAAKSALGNTFDNSWQKWVGDAP